MIMSLKKYFAQIISVIIIATCNLQAQDNLMVIPDFNKIIVKGNLSINYYESDEIGITIPDNELSTTVTYVVKKNKLKIKNKRFKSNRNYTVTASVYGKPLNQITLRAGAIVKSEGNILTDTVKILLTSGSELYSNAENKKIHSRINRGSFFQYTGKTDELKLRTCSGAKFRGNKAEIGQAYVKANTGGFAALATKIKGKASLGGEIKVYGAQQSNTIKKILWGKITEGDENEL